MPSLPGLDAKLYDRCKAEDIGLNISTDVFASLALADNPRRESDPNRGVFGPKINGCDYEM